MNRFFRPEPANIVSNDPNSLQESTVDSEPAKCGHAEGDASGRGVDEEHPLATASLLSSSRTVVAWELCTTEIDLGPDEESMQHKTQLSRGSESKASEEGEGTREEQFAQTGSDDAGLLLAKDEKKDELEENRGQKLCARGRNETPESDEYEEHLNTGSQRLTGDAMSEDMEESGRKEEEETERATTPDDLKEMDETTTKIHAMEEDDKMHREEDQDLEAEDVEVKLCTITDLSLEQEDNKRIEEARVARDEADTAVMHEEVENSDGVLLLASECENKSDEEARQVENQLSVCEELSGDIRDLRGDPDFTSLHELQMAHDKSGIVSEDVLIVAGQEHVTAHRSESDKAEDEGTLDERERGAVREEEDVHEAANNRTIDEAPEQEDDIKTVAEDRQEEDILTGHGACSEEVAQNAKTELHAVKFTDGEGEEVAKDTEVQTKGKETDGVEAESHGALIDEKSDVTTTDISADEVEEERLSSDIGNKESYMGVACTATAVTVKPQGETGQEISGAEFKNVPPGICEGRLVVPRELNSLTCEETQEGVPEYNNEPGEPDENTTQRFLEVGDCEEIPTTQLPEEVESEDPESLQNSGCSTGADYSLVREHMGEEQDGTEDFKSSFDLAVKEHTGILRLTDLPQETEKPLEPVIEESGLLFEEEEGNLLFDSMKTGVEQSEKEFETHVGLTDETDEATKELQDGTEGLLIEFEIDEGLCDSKEADVTGAEAAEVQKMTETSFFQELVDAINSEQNGNRTPSLLEDITEFGFMKQSIETEPELLEASAVEMQDAGIDMEETGYGVEEEAAEDEMQSKNEVELLNLQAAGMAAGLTTERNEKENTLIAELSESPETKTQVSDEALETSNEEMLTDTKAADGSMTTESKPEGLTAMSAVHVMESEGSYAEETFGSISGRQDVIDEEILDLWIQTVLSEDTDGIEKQERPEQHMDTEIEPSSKEEDDVSSVQTEKDKEQIVEANPGESELVSDTEMSSSTVESGFLDQSLSEWGTQNSEAQLLKSTSTGSFQGIYDMLSNMSESADTSEVSTQLANSGSQDILTEETAETGESYLKEEELITEAGFLPYSGVTSSEARGLNQESDGSQEKTDEETGSQETDLARKSDWKDAEEADVESLTETSALVKPEETGVEVEPLEITAPDSGRSRSGSEASLEEGVASTESGSQDDTCTESELPSPDKPQPGWSEDVGESFPGLNRDEVAEQPTTASEDEMEVSFPTKKCLIKSLIKSYSIHNLQRWCEFSCFDIAGGRLCTGLYCAKVKNCC